MESKKISLGVATPLALQHIVAMVVGCVTVPLILGGAGGIPQADQVIMVQASLFCSALAIFLHAFTKFNIGSGLPVVIGSGFAFIPTLTSVVQHGGMSAVLGAQLVGSLAGILVGVFFKRIRFLFPPLVTASVVITIGISLYPTAVNYMGGNAGSATFGSLQNWIVAMITLVAVLFFSHFCKGILKVSATLLGLLVGYIVAACLGMVNFSGTINAGWVALPQPFHFGMSFTVGAIVSMVVIFIINAIQDIGQFEATATGVYNRPATNRELSGGVIANNISSFVGSILGSTPNATCGQNVGIVVTTGVTDRFVFLVASIILVISAFIPKVSSIFLTIPYPVLGGATICVFASISMTGIRMLSNAGLTQRNVAISGLAIALAVGIAQTPNVFKGCPEWMNMLFGGSEIVVVALVAVILNLVIPKEKG